MVGRSDLDHYLSLPTDLLRPDFQNSHRITTSVAVGDRLLFVAQNMVLNVRWASLRAQPVLRSMAEAMEYLAFIGNADPAHMAHDPSAEVLRRAGEQRAINLGRKQRGHGI